MPVTLEQIPLISWVRFGIGIFLFLGPGSLLLTFSPFRKELDRTLSIVVAFGYSVALWAILLSITYLLRINLSPLFSIGVFALCWVAVIWKTQIWRKSFKLIEFSKDTTYRILLWGILFILLLIRLWIVRHEVAGLGSDSYHHTLFTQMIMDQGALPRDLGPGFPIITYTYHYGFHATTAFLGWVSGIPTRLLLLIVGYVIVLFCSLGVGLSAEKMVGTKIAGLIAAILTAGFFIFPSYMLQWGRYTQLTGLTLMAVFIGLFWLWMKNGYTKSGIIELGILAAGIGLTHYRIVALTAVGALVIAVVMMEGKDFRNWSRWKTMLSRGALLVLAALVCSAAWLFHLWESSRVGYSIVSAPPKEVYFSIRRLGGAVDFPLNYASLTLFSVSLLAGWFTKNKIVIALTLWGIVALLPSQNWVLLDTVSVIISMFIPIGIITAWGINTLIDKVNISAAHVVIKKGLPIVFLTAMAAASIVANLTFTTPLDSYLKKSDLRAFEYIEENISVDAKFMVNLYRFSFSDILMVGSDGGYWLPLQTKRQSVVPPMVFTNEKVSDPSFADRLRALEGLNGQITSKEGLELMNKENITHVYIGERGGPIDPNALLSSPYFTLIYEDGPVYIFEFNG